MIKDIIESNECKNVNEDKINALKNIIPNCFCKDGSLDIELLKKEFKKDLEFSKESFELNFLGKSYAKMIAGLDTETVIEPDIEHNLRQENKNSENIYISGDNLDALKHLLKAYEGKIKCIYIDPPYNTGKDGFGYNDTFNFSRSSLVEKLDISGEEADRILNLNSTNSSSHSAWLTFMYPRIYLAKRLLKKSGVIFISIDDNEVYNLKQICDGIFGEENFVSQITWQCLDTIKNDAKYFSDNDEYILCYANSKDDLVIKGVKKTEKQKAYYKNYDNDPRGDYLLTPLHAKSGGENSIYTYTFKNGQEWIPIEGTYPRFSKETLKKLEDDNRIYLDPEGNNVPQKKTFWNEVGDRMPSTTFWGYEEYGSTRQSNKEITDLLGKGIFKNSKPTKLIKNIIDLVCDENDIVLDFFSGSATTADAVIQLNAMDQINLKFILVQIQEECQKNSEAYKSGYKTIDEIGQERIERVAKKVKRETNADIDYGFKHYTLKETPKDLLNKLELFNPELVNDNYEIYKEYGIETILETWKLKDGYEFTTEVETIDCNNYDAYKCGECLYLINPNITINNIQSLLNKYSKEENFVCDKLVLFGYSFKFNEIEMIKNNIKQVKSFKNVDVKVYTRY